MQKRDNGKFDIQEYMTGGVVRIVTDSLRAVAKNPKEAAFMGRFAIASKKASARRMKAEKEGEHIPPFLIASITSNCNLHCAGCYSRANHACEDTEPVSQMTEEEWERIFAEAEGLGISFILLAGGEPLIRYDVIKQASEHKDILFPIFTNGTFLGEKYLELMDENRNLLPVISIEGDEVTTDGRRGAGVYRKVIRNMENIRDRGMVFGASVTVTTENMQEVYSDEFINRMHELGCKAIIYVEFVPVTEDSTHLAPAEDHYVYMNGRLNHLRENMKEMVFISFPGDEKSSGGCVAAGRGFFHINSHGGAEPCPFSPYSDISVRDTSIREAMRSPLFFALNSEGLLSGDHAGGCTLYANKERVEQIIAGAAAG